MDLRFGTEWLRTLRLLQMDARTAHSPRTPLTNTDLKIQFAEAMFDAQVRANAEGQQGTGAGKSGSSRSL
jgi:hypothetical protein